MATTVEILDGPTILAGQSLSEKIDCSAGRIARITIPKEFSQTTVSNILTFQVSSDGVEPFFNDLYNSDGSEYSIRVGPDRAVIVNQAIWLPGFWLKVRSGSRAQPMPQDVDCKFALALLVETP